MMKRDKAYIDWASLFWEETRSTPLPPPIHHGTTLKLLSTDYPSAVTRVPA